MEKNQIQDLKKNDQFVFNQTLYTVKRKWINDDKPLIATYGMGREDLFHHEGLEISYVGTVTKPLI